MRGQFKLVLLFQTCSVPYYTLLKCYTWSFRIVSLTFRLERLFEIVIFMYILHGRSWKTWPIYETQYIRRWHHWKSLKTRITFDLTEINLYKYRIYMQCVYCKEFITAKDFYITDLVSRVAWVTVLKCCNGFSCSIVRSEKIIVKLFVLFYF